MRPAARNVAYWLGGQQQAESRQRNARAKAAGEGSPGKVYESESPKKGRKELALNAACSLTTVQTAAAVAWAQVLCSLSFARSLSCL